MLAQESNLRRGRAGRIHSPGRSRYIRRAACLQRGGAARYGGTGSPGAGSGRPAQQRLRIPHAPHYRQPGAGRPEKGRPGLRPAHCRGHFAQLRPNLPARRTLFVPGRTIPGRQPAPHQRRAAQWCRWPGTQGFSAVYVPTADASEAALVEGIQVYPTPHPGCPGEPSAWAKRPSGPRSLPACPAARGRRPTAATWPTSRARNTPSALSRWQPPASTISCSTARRAAARPCWPAPCRPFSPR